MKTIILFGLAIAGSAATITPSIAAEPLTVTSIVRTADLDLSSAAGQQQLDLRIARAAREVCGTPSPVDLEGYKAVQDCRERTVAQAASQREQLLAAARTGVPIMVASAR